MTQITKDSNAIDDQTAASDPVDDKVPRNEIAVTSTDPVHSKVPGNDVTMTSTDAANDNGHGNDIMTALTDPADDSREIAMMDSQVSETAHTEESITEPPEEERVQ
jgi:hypothetical protein